MIHNRMYVRREYGISVFIDRDSRICPPEEGLRHIGTIVELPFDLDIGFVRVEGKCAHALCAIHLVDFADIYGGGSVLMLLIEIIYRRISRRTVMLRPVKFDAAGDPWSGKAYKRRFDHMVIIDKIVVVGLVIGALDPSTDLRQDHHLQIVVFQVNGMVCHIFFFVGYFFCDRKRIYLSAASLISPVLKKERAFFRICRRVGRNGDCFFPHMYTFHCHNSSPFVSVRRILELRIA